MAYHCAVEEAAVSSPIGILTLTFCQQGLHSVSQAEKLDDGFVPSIGFPVKLVEKSDTNSNVSCNNVKNKENNTIILDQCLDWIHDYFTDPYLVCNRDIPKICTSLRDGSFRDKVRTALVENVKAGQTISYGELACLVSNRGASRAVGSTMSNNPFSIMIPCHRVINSDGQFGNYGKGKRNEIKRWLLEFEKYHSMKKARI